MILLVFSACLPLILCVPDPDINLYVHLESREAGGGPQVAPGDLGPSGNKIAKRRYKKGRANVPRYRGLENRSTVRYESPGGETKCSYKCRWALLLVNTVTRSNGYCQYHWTTSTKYDDYERRHGGTGTCTPLRSPNIPLANTPGLEECVPGINAETATNTWRGQSSI